jgi:mannitol/fructose-specific phosphotransferase system IIA component (Ntr-type)
MLCELASARVRGSIADYTRPELMVPRLGESDPPGIIKELSRRLQDQRIIGDLLSFYHAAINHEFLGHSALSLGVALPHVRSPQVARLTLAVGRTPQPVIWGARGSWPVTLVFLLAVPPTDARDHLALLSGIAGLIRQPENLARLTAASGDMEMYDLLKEIRVPG